MEGERNPARACRNRCSLIFRWSLIGAGVGEGVVGTLGLALPSLPWRGPQLSSPLSLEDEEKRGRALARCPLVFPWPPSPSHNPPQLWRLLVSKLGRRIPQLRPAPSYLQASGPGPPFLHPTSSASSSHLPLHHGKTVSRPSLHTRIPRPEPISAPHPHNSPRLSPRGLRGRSTKGGAAAAPLRMLLPPPPPPSLLPPLPSTGPGALSPAMLVRGSGARVSAPAFGPHPLL